VFSTMAATGGGLSFGGGGGGGGGDSYESNYSGGNDGFGMSVDDDDGGDDNVGGGNQGGSSYSSGSGGGGGKTKLNPFMAAFACLVMGVVAIVLAIVLPIREVNNPRRINCTEVPTLNWKEQMTCTPIKARHKFAANAKSAYVKLYKGTKGMAKIRRSMEYSTRHYNVTGRFIQFGFSVPLSMVLDVKVTCEGDGCDGATMCWMDHDYFTKVVVDGKLKKEPEESTVINKGFNSAEFSGNITSGSEIFYHLLFYSVNESGLNIWFSADYEVYDVSAGTVVDCDLTTEDKCKVDDLKDGEILILDLPSSDGEMTSSAGVSELDVNWSSVLALGIVLGLLGVACIGGAVYFGLKAGKKLKKKAKKVAKKMRQ